MHLRLQCGKQFGQCVPHCSHKNIKCHLFVAKVRAMAHIFWPMHPPLQQQGHLLALRMAMRPSIDGSRFHPEAQEMRLRLQWAMQWTKFLIHTTINGQHVKEIYR